MNRTGDAARLASESLPYLLEVNHRGKKIVVCHADFPEVEYAGDISDASLFDVIWSRSRINDINEGRPVSPEICGADFFIFGHTPMKKPLDYGNCKWIDTGAVFGNEITVVSLTANQMKGK